MIAPLSDRRDQGYPCDQPFETLCCCEQGRSQLAHRVGRAMAANRRRADAEVARSQQLTRNGAEQLQHAGMVSIAPPRKRT